MSGKSNISWLRIILYILMLIISGLNETDAAGRASELFGVSIEEILKHL